MPRERVASCDEDLPFDEASEAVLGDISLECCSVLLWCSIGFEVICGAASPSLGLARLLGNSSVCAAAAYE